MHASMQFVEHVLVLRNIEASRSYNFSFFVTKLVLRGCVLGYHLSMGPRITNLILFFFDVSKHWMLVFGNLRWKQLFTWEVIVSSPHVPIPLQIQKITIDLNCPWQSFAWGYLVGQIHLTHPFPPSLLHLMLNIPETLSLYWLLQQQHSCYTMQLLQKSHEHDMKKLGFVEG
jgi:hypothetical protein